MPPTLGLGAAGDGGVGRVGQGGQNEQGRGPELGSGNPEPSGDRRDPFEGDDQERRDQGDEEPAGLGEGPDQQQGEVARNDQARRPEPSCPDGLPETDEQHPGRHDREGRGEGVGRGTKDGADLDERPGEGVGEPEDVEPEVPREDFRQGTPRQQVQLRRSRGRQQMPSPRGDDQQSPQGQSRRDLRAATEEQLDPDGDADRDADVPEQAQGSEHRPEPEAPSEPDGPDRADRREQGELLEQEVGRLRSDRAADPVPGPVACQGEAEQEGDPGRVEAPEPMPGDRGGGHGAGDREQVGGVGRSPGDGPERGQHRGVAGGKVRVRGAIGVVDVAVAVALEQRSGEHRVAGAVESGGLVEAGVDRDPDEGQDRDQGAVPPSGTIEIETMSPNARCRRLNHIGPRLRSDWGSEG